MALGQTIKFPQGDYGKVFLLVAATWGSVSGMATVNYTDGSTSSGSLSVPDWEDGSPGVVNTSYRYSPTDIDQGGAIHIYAVQIGIDWTKMASSLTLPSTAVPSPNTPSLHVFALTLQYAVQGYATKVLDAHSTTKMMAGASTTQIVEATVENNGTKWFTPSHPTRVSVDGKGVQTAVPAVISELGPGEQVIVEVGIKKSASIPDGTQVSGTVVAQSVGGNTDRFTFPLTVGVPQYSATDASLSQHQAPDWFNNAKFGIFIHWGVYSVPAWAPVGQEYAEWYWHAMHNKQDPTYQHQLQIYGPTSEYDDFIPQFTAANFDPKAWVQLFNQAGAKYFVLVSKHHDGFALFQTKYSHRDAVDLGPHKDLVKELFDASAQYTPNLKRGLYYSLPEWYNPAYHGSGDFSGGPPTQYVTGQQIPYTGYIPVKDYVQDFQKPQMLELVHNYKPDILWCDIGGQNDSPTVFADYFNQALQSGQQVTVDDRCGIKAHDFTTPEYNSFKNLVVQKWE
ncbi:MAG TPA: alpha-L-fucosidase, partial [Ktedonobacteraceae bacterium]|nr:alpha-L-fucosidase [Ktedonobacteraceae bacterium]